MATLEQRIAALAGAIRDKINLMVPRLIPSGGAVNQVLTKTGAGNYAVGWQASSGASPAGCHALGPSLAAGAYIAATINATALSTIAAAANRLDFIPFIPAKNVTINELQLEVTTLIAGSQARVGIYDSTAAGAPNALLTGQGSLLDCATVGAKASAITSITLTAGTVYWLAVHTSAAQTLRGIAVAALLALDIPATGGAVNVLRRATPAFATGLPANAPATTLTSSIAPLLRLKLA